MLLRYFSQYIKSKSFINIFTLSHQFLPSINPITCIVVSGKKEKKEKRVKKVKKDKNAPKKPMSAFFCY
jgi:hypothetical protein